MSTENAKAYMRRMRTDPAFKRQVEAQADDDARWDFIRAQGYEFTFREFDAAQVELMAEFGADDPGRIKG